MDDPATTPYERSDLNVRGTVWFMTGLVVVLIGIFIALHFFQSALIGSHPQAVRPPQNSVSGPRLQSHPAADLAAWRTAQEAELHRCQWVDRKAGIIEIPIERAMELIVQRGLPSRTSKGGPP